MNKKVLVNVLGVSKFYPDGNTQALRNVNLKVYESEFLVIKGASGSGKSTLLHLLGGLDSPTEGQIVFEDQDLETIRHRNFFRLVTIGFVFQTFYLWPTLNVSENVMLPLLEVSLTPAQRRARAKELVGRVGLQRKLYARVGDLSVGERQRVAIARALINSPKLLLADEPTGSLDSKNKESVFDLFRALNRERALTIVMVTHEHLPARLSSRTLEIADGAITQ